ncbi:MAG: ABC transporter permease subunit [Aeromicrobium erythreum]
MSTTTPATVDTSVRSVPVTRLVGVELRKMFDTRSGFWLMASIGIIALLATIGVIAFVPPESLSYGIFGSAFGVPMNILLPVVAILAVTSEWSQRTGLVTFTLVPHRGAVVLSKFLAVIAAGVMAMLVVLAVGALGNLVGSGIRGVSPQWDLSLEDFLLLLLGNVLSMLIGFMLGILIRNSAAAIVAYFVYSFVVPTIFGVLSALPATKDWFGDIQPWIDVNSAIGQLFDQPTAKDWAHLLVSSIPWFFLPMGLGIWRVLRAEVK